MKVKELIEKLQKMDQDREVCYYYEDIYMPITCVVNGVNELDGLVVLDMSEDDREELDNIYPCRNCYDKNCNNCIYSGKLY